MKCLIIAAGKGSRLQSKGESKPLILLLGAPLIERAILTAKEAGITDYYVVIGYQGEKVKAFLNDLAGRLEISITTIFNSGWEKENGLSVLKAKDFLCEPFLLLMSDHLFDSSIVRDLIKINLSKEGIALAVDGNIQNPLIDMGDVTRVKTEACKIVNIGKGLEDFNGFDTGIFYCTPAIFGALEECPGQFGDTSLSGAVRIMAGKGNLEAFYINGRFWIDVDDSASFKRAEKALLFSSRNKPNDGFVARYINRPLSVRISRVLVNYSITPNQISLFSFFCSMIAACLFAVNGYFALFFGALIAQFASVVDGCDGEVARLKFQSNDYGGWLDAVLDRYSDGFLLFGLTWHAYAEQGNEIIFIAGFLAIIGSFVLSYTADKNDNIMRNRISRGNVFRLGRDSRVAIIATGAIFNQVFLTLIVIALLMNIETIRRLVVFRKS